MIQETIPTGATITYQGIEYTTDVEVNVTKVEVTASEPVATVDPSTVTATDTAPVDPIVTPDAPQPSVEQVEIAPGETIEITEAAQ